MNNLVFSHLFKRVVDYWPKELTADVRDFVDDISWSAQIPNLEDISEKIECNFYDDKNEILLVNINHLIATSAQRCLFSQKVYRVEDLDVDFLKQLFEAALNRRLEDEGESQESDEDAVVIREYFNNN